MCVEICEITDERTPSRPASIAMVNVAAPKPCATTWTVFAPVAARTRATADGKSWRAMSSPVYRCLCAGRSMLDR